MYKRVLFIDDDEEDLDIFITAIRSLALGVEAEATSDALIALARLESGELEPDLIFLDLNMPGMNGQEFLRAIKGKHGLRHIPVIVLSTTGRPETVEQVKSLGAAGYIIKPSEYTIVRDTFQKLLTP